MSNDPAPPASAPPYPTPFSDHVYAVKHGVELRLRVFPADVAAPAPWVLWSHGGAWLMCHHEGISPWVVPGFRQRGVHLVSFAYRLAPHASLADMASDGADALAWCRTHLPSMLSVDIDAYATGGDSAGGHISTLLGSYLSPPPRAVLDIYGIVDLADTHWDTMKNPDRPLSGRFTADEIEAGIMDRDPSHALTSCPLPEQSAIPGLPADAPADTVCRALEETYRKELHAPYLQVTARHLLQQDVMVELDRRGYWVQATVHPEKFPRDQREAEARKWSPLYRLPEAPIQGEQAYPPTVIIHGDADDCVPIDQSRRFAQRLKELGVPVQECYEEGTGHGLDHRFVNEDIPGYDAIARAALDFISKHVRASRS